MAKVVSKSPRGGNAGQEDSTKRVLFIVLAVLALAIAAFSAYKSLAPPQGKNMGSLGDLGEGKREVMDNPNASRANPDAAAGAPAVPGGSDPSLTGGKGP
jgi:hypothetical protein